MRDGDFVYVNMDSPVAKPTHFLPSVYGVFFCGRKGLKLQLTT
jgi:hypothetical protein